MSVRMRIMSIDEYWMGPKDHGDGKPQTGSERNQKAEIFSLDISVLEP